MLSVRIIIVILMLLPGCFLTGCRQQVKQPATTSDSVNVISKQAPSINDKTGVHGPFIYGVSLALLRLNAGQKQGLTQKQMDSLQRLISLRKKF